MYRTAASHVDDRIRGAIAARDERKRLGALRGALAVDLAHAEQDVLELAQVRADEELDVVRFQGGVRAFLYELVGDREARLDREQREAAEALVRQQESIAVRDRLREVIAELEARMAALASAEADLAAARRDRETALIAAGGLAAGALARVDEALGVLDGESRAIHEALAVGRRVSVLVDELFAVLTASSTVGGIGVSRHSFDQAALAGRIRAELVVFWREVADLDATLPNGDRPYVWGDSAPQPIIGVLAQQWRLVYARSQTAALRVVLADAVDELRARRTRVDECIAALDR